MLYHFVCLVNSLCLPFYHSFPIAVDNQAESLMRYFLEFKRIPYPIDAKLLHDLHPPEVLCCDETTCPSCNSTLDVKSEKSSIVCGYGILWHGTLSSL